MLLSIANEYGLPGIELVVPKLADIPPVALGMFAGRYISDGVMQRSTIK